MEKTAVITGASTGIGWAACKALVAAGWRVFGSVRKVEDGARLSAELGEAFTPLLFDVTDEAAVQAGAAQVRAALGERRLGALVNNAGIAVAGPLLHLPVAEFRKQLEVNLTGVLIATQAFAPLLGSEPGQGAPGRIVNIGSVGGRVAFPFMGPYNTTKFGLEGFTEALRRELLVFGIDAILVAPAAVATPIWDKADAVDVAPYQGTVYAGPLDRIRSYMLKTGREGLPVETLGEGIRAILEDPNPKVRYVFARNRFESWLAPKLPKRLMDRSIGKRLGLLP